MIKIIIEQPGGLLVAYDAFDDPDAIRTQKATARRNGCRVVAVVRPKY